MRHVSLSLLSALAIVLCAFNVAVVDAQTSRGPYTDVKELPDNAVGHRAKELIDAINTSNDDALRAFVNDAFAPGFLAEIPLADHVHELRSLRETNGPIAFHAVRKYEQPRPDNELVCIVRGETTEAWLGVEFAIEPSAPNRITRLMLMQARPPSDLPTLPPLTRAEMASEARRYVEKLAAADAFSGAVLIGFGDEVLFEAAYGSANKRYDAPNRVDTKFNLGSMNKMFTAVAVAQLAEQGKLDFEDVVSKYLSDDWLSADAANKIRVRDLLAHTSGLGSYFDSPKFWDSSRAVYRNLADYKPLIDSKLSFEPGDAWSYSNTGLLLAGVIVEKVGGESYYDYIREHIYTPAKMIDSDCYDMDRPVKNLAYGYSKAAEAFGTNWEENTFKHVIKGGPAGGGFSTVHDLFHFSRALMGGKLVTEKTREQLWTRTAQSQRERAMSYGMGFVVAGEPGHRIVGHSGGFPGISANLDIFTDSGFTAVVLSNYDNAARVVSDKFRELVNRVK